MGRCPVRVKKRCFGQTWKEGTFRRFERRKTIKKFKIYKIYQKDPNDIPVRDPQQSGSRPALSANTGKRSSSCTLGGRWTSVVVVAIDSSDHPGGWPGRWLRSVCGLRVWSTSYCRSSSVPSSEGKTATLWGIELTMAQLHSVVGGGVSCRENAESIESSGPTQVKQI